MNFITSHHSIHKKCNAPETKPNETKKKQQQQTTYITLILFFFSILLVTYCW